MDVQGSVPRRSAGCPQLPVMLGTNLRMMFFHVQMLGSVWNECFESPYDMLHHISWFFLEAFHPYYLFGVYIYF